MLLGAMYILQQYPLDTYGRLPAHGIGYRAQLTTFLKVQCMMVHVL